MSNKQFKIIGLLVVLGCSAFAKAQLQSSQWFFGNNAGIDFRSGTVTETGNSAMVTGEGCAALSDDQGNLLFYTDGSTIYNRNDQVMVNGTGLKGNSSSTSSAVVVPLPGTDARFYVFTVDTDDLVYRNAAGMHYSIVDMQLDSGNGAVELESKNIQILERTSEKLTAIENGSDTGYWIMTQFEDKFYSYELTASGLNLEPVVSQVDPFIELVDYFVTNVDVAAMRGYMKVNSSGTKIAAAHFSNNTLADFNGASSILEARSIAFAQGGELYLYDFDNTTGVVSNPIPLLTRADGGSFYGLEFSPNGRYLYAEIDYLSPSRTAIYNFLGGEIAQFDLSATDILNSKRTIYQDNFLLFRGAMQLGIDGKIYHSRLEQPALSVLSNPNDQAAPVNYRFNEQPLATGTQSAYGLPIFVQSFFQEFELKLEDACAGAVVPVMLDTAANDFTVVWDFGDPASGGENSSVQPATEHVYRSPGTYTVTATIQTVFQQIILRETVTIAAQVSIGDFPQLLSVCDEGMGVGTFDLAGIAAQISTLPDQVVNIYPTAADAAMQLDAISLADPYASSTTTLFVRVDNDNCFEILELELTVERCELEVFNVITPNGDGANDTLIIQGLRNIYPAYTISIFNRWGRLIWDGGPQTEDWDGTSNQSNGRKLLPAGTYFYTIELNDELVVDKSGYVYLTY